MDSLDYICMIQEVRDQKLGKITDAQAQKCLSVGDVLDALS